MTGTDDGRETVAAEPDEQPGDVDGDSPSGTPERRATVTTTHADERTAARVAAALAPDNTPSIDTGVDGDRVVTTVARDATGGLRSTVDDYVVNATVAARLATDATQRRDEADGTPHPGNGTDRQPTDDDTTTHDT